MSDADRWRAVLARDAGADDRFFTGVLTTGVYCRPSCPARHPKRENVRFFSTAAAAEAAGLRPCRRCRPTEPRRAEREARLVAAACRTIETAEVAPSLGDLAGASGLSPYHFQRLFKACLGLSPHAYAAAHRHRAVVAALPRAESVTEAIYAAGYGSGSRFYASTGKALPMKPRDLRATAVAETIAYVIRDCLLGRVLVGVSDKGVCAIFIGDDTVLLQGELAERFPKAALVVGEAGLDALVDRVVALVERPGSSELPLDIRGTAFQHKVWQALCEIQPGETATYGEIARRIGAPRAVRAVAAACGANKLAVAVPCHRVVGADGRPTGYRWGLQRKRALLERERKG
jgi:AraC family transcriptional regulator, regulatory protein of adaptative response / methylated-DNA-[protein]-cysteine methyltransferase